MSKAPPLPAARRYPTSWASWRPRQPHDAAALALALQELEQRAARSRRLALTMPEPTTPKEA